jgi:hypothetical protein
VSKSPCTKASGRYTASARRSSARSVTMFFSKSVLFSVDSRTLDLHAVEDLRRHLEGADQELVAVIDWRFHDRQIPQPRRVAVLRIADDVAPASPW